MTIDQAVRQVIKEELKLHKEELIREILGFDKPNVDEVAEEAPVEEKPKRKRAPRKKKEEPKEELPTEVAEEDTSASADEPVDPIEEEHIADATEAKYRDKCHDEGIDPDTGEKVSAPIMTNTNEFLASLMAVINGGITLKKEKTERKKKAIDLLSKEYGLQKFSEVEEDQFLDVYEAVVNALK